MRDMLKLLVSLLLIASPIAASDTLFTQITDGVEATVWITTDVPTSLEPIGVSGAVTFISITDYVYIVYYNKKYIILTGDWKRPSVVGDFR